MTRVLAIQLRRSGAPGAVLLLLAGVVALYWDTRRWASGWMALAMTQRTSLMLLCPIALAAGAWLSRREHQAKVAELFAATPRPRHQRVVPTLTAVGIAVAGAYLATLLPAVPWIAGTAGYLPGAAFGVVAAGLVSLVAAAWLGLAVGRLVPGPATAPMLAVAGFLTILAAPFGFREDWLSMLVSPAYGMDFLVDFHTVPLRASVAQTLLAIALAASGAVLLAASGWPGRAAASIPVVLGVALSLVVMPHDYQRLTIDPVARQLVCTQDAPRVCVSRMHAALLTEVTPPAREALALLAKLPNPPATAQEDTNVYYGENPVTRPGPETLTFRFDVGADGHVEDREFLLSQMLESGGAGAVACPEGNDPAVSRAVSAWLADRPVPRYPSDDEITVLNLDGSPAEPVEVAATALLEKLRKLPESQALARVAAVRRAALECTDLSGLLDGTAR